MKHLLAPYVKVRGVYAEIKVVGSGPKAASSTLLCGIGFASKLYVGCSIETGCG